MAIKKALPVILIIATAAIAAAIYMPKLLEKPVSPTEASDRLVMSSVELIAKGDYEKAKTTLLEAIRLDEWNQKAYICFDKLYSSLYSSTEDALKKKEVATEAVKRLEVARRFFPSSPMFSFTLALWYMRQTEWTKAEEALNSTLRLEPKGEIAESSKAFLILVKEAKRSKPKKQR